MNTLECDREEYNNRYAFTQNNESQMEIEKLFGKPPQVGEVPPRIVQSKPGFCVKTKEVGTDKKVFVNICTIDSIPPPKDITTEELEEILTTDEITDYRIPMSIGDLHSDRDNKDQLCSICDVAINVTFYQKIVKEVAFKQFLLAVVFEGIRAKYGIVTADDKIILKNKAFMGSLQTHRIQQREVEEKMGLPPALPKFDDVLRSQAANSGSNITVLSESKKQLPRYRLFTKEDAKTLFAEIHLPYAQSSKDVTLDIGEDRIVMESCSGNYFLDIFHQFTIDQSSCKSMFCKESKCLTVTMLIKNC